MARIDPPFMSAEVRRLHEHRQANTCPECERITDAHTRPGNEHWPWCSEAPIANQVRYAKHHPYPGRRRGHAETS